ncbi:TNF receptor-associated factor 3 interacting protein 1 [Nesidiocoris tenuis]|uniref:TNF receptor-associated factor 3 interacting protein 1 n=1 Tax=Nesidiocoris tenuis TaxID=355587 RepID=A0ABN7B4B7_9HEMI|nr:TNF receptor-associated factor 3 interacting protein 1 [Nesidiocoris tenuis]
MDDVPLHVIKETQALLGKYIKEPPLTEKLLKKPPFRFLQDIVKSVVKETGYLGDVFSTEELSENIKEKEKKIAFLKKLINSLQSSTGSTINARPSKIVAGVEVTKTLELLQCLAMGIAFKDTAPNVKLAVNNEKKEKKKLKDAESRDSAKKPKPSKTDDSKGDSAKTKKKRPDSKEGATDEKKEKKNKELKKVESKAIESKNGVKTKEKGDEKSRNRSAKDPNEVVKSRKKSAEIQEDGVERPEKAKERPSSKKRSSDAQEQDASKISVLPNVQEEDKENNSTATGRLPLTNGDATGASDALNAGVTTETAKLTNGTEENKENADFPNVSESRKPSLDGTKEKPEKKEKQERRERSKDGSAVERKTSSRRSSSKVRPASKNTESGVREKRVDEEPAVLGSGESAVPILNIERPQTARKPPPSARPASARPGAPKIRDRGEVKTEIAEPEKEVKVIPVITDAEKLQDDENTVTVERQTISPDFETQGANFIDTANKVGENEGALVAQILETKKELEETGQIISGDSSNQKNVEIEWEGGKKHKKEAWSREIAKLRDGIQQLTRSTNPLGKLFDFLQEDVDSMQRELKLWKETNANYSKELERERRLTENSLETYKRQLAELDSLIDQESEALKNMKANVLANDRKIYSLLTKTSVE